MAYRRTAPAGVSCLTIRAPDGNDGLRSGRRRLSRWIHAGLPRRTGLPSFTGDPVAVTIERGSISRLTDLERGCSGSAGGRAVREIDAAGSRARRGGRLLRCALLRLRSRGGRNRCRLRLLHGCLRLGSGFGRREHVPGLLVDQPVPGVAELSRVPVVVPDKPLGAPVPGRGRRGAGPCPDHELLARA